VLISPPPLQKYTYAAAHNQEAVDCAREFFFFLSLFGIFIDEIDYNGKGGRYQVSCRSKKSIAIDIFFND